MADELAAQIETFLLQQGDWVSVAALVERFNVPERRLRAHGRRPGLLASFAVTDSRLGVIHTRHLSLAGWLRVKHRRMRHAISEIRASAS